MPGLNFAGYDAPFTWKNFSPRAGLTYALDESRKTVARASYSRFSGQLDSASVGYMNPSSSAGVAVYRWLDNNSDHFAQADEVQLNQFLGAANGFNPANPTAVTSANRINPDLKAPVTQSFVAGVDREIKSNFAVGVSYTYTRTTNLLGNATFSVTPRVGVTLADYAPGPDADGHAARRQQLQRADLHPEPGEGDRRRQRLPADQLGRLLHRLPRPRVQRREAALEPVDGARRRRVQQRPRALRAAGAVRHERQPDADRSPSRSSTAASSRR